LNKVEIPDAILAYAEFTAPSLTPYERKSGWNELPTERRGDGDLLDLMGSLIIFHGLSSNGRLCSLDITCGMGDDCDLRAVINGAPRTINVKTSSYDPEDEDFSRLHLYVKSEELEKRLPDIYIQCFIHHIDMAAMVTPHVHITGWIPTHSQAWKEQPVITIPRTNGHKGIGVKIEQLETFEKLVGMVDRKF
jgi:hypothetical protein